MSAEPLDDAGNFLDASRTKIAEKLESMPATPQWQWARHALLEVDGELEHIRRRISNAARVLGDLPA